MKQWRVVVRPEAPDEVVRAVEWHEARQVGPGAEFREALIQVFDAPAENPLPNYRRHPRRNFRWRSPPHFPYRVIYEIIEAEGTVVVAALLHAARNDRHRRKRI